MRQFRSIARLCAPLILVTGFAFANPVFDFTWGPTIAANVAAEAAFQAAAARWSALFSDNVTLNIYVDFSASLPAGALGGSQSYRFYNDYSGDPSYSVSSMLQKDAKTADDQTAVSHLQAGPLAALTNIDPRISVNTLHTGFTSAEAKALGYNVTLPAGSYDGVITFTADPTGGWDYNPGDGITGYDLVGVATHELAHIMGFLSRVDRVDECLANVPGACTGDTPDGQMVYNVFDLFRYSSPGQLDWRADTTAKYFSIDGGASDLADLSTGHYNGDGWQASHWLKSSPPNGIMNPTISGNTVASISLLDMRALDVIGWDLVGEPVPEAASPVLLATFFAIVWAHRRYTRRNG